MKKGILTIVLASLMVLFITSITLAIDVSVTPEQAKAGGSASLSGTADRDTWVTIKILDTDQNIVFFDALIADSEGTYNCIFKVPDVSPGVLNIVAGNDNTTAAAELSVIRSRSKRSTTPSEPVNSSTGQAAVKPDAGGNVSLGSQAAVDIPAGALKGNARVRVEISEVAAPPNKPSGFKFMGSIYEFKVGGAKHHNFDKPVTLTFTFDPAALPPGEQPQVYYYDEASKQWVSLGGTAKGNTITVTVDHFTQFAVMAEELAAVPIAVNLTDITGHWAEDNIRELVSAGIIKGYADGNFKPDNIITRAEFATVLVKAFQLEATEGRVFADTAEHWAKDCIAAAADNGIVNGYDTDTFGPNDPVTREQMAVMTAKAANLPKTTDSIEFSDSSEIANWAIDAAAAACSEQIMSGYPDNTFRPQANATRAEAVTIITRAK